MLWGKFWDWKKRACVLHCLRFKGVDFRLQEVAQHKGITFVNDTTASTPTAAKIALNTFPENKIIWIAGGNTKNLPLGSLVKTATQRVKKVVLLKGSGTRELEQSLKDSVTNWEDMFLGEYDDFKAAVNTAYQNAEPGDVVLLSPGLTSFSMFN
jgi:UDP-N-acetylmuramoylalanine--D-glutamate ligase